MKLKPKYPEFEPQLDILDGFYLIVDTREQNPLFTTTDKYVVKKYLPAGDYSILGFEDIIAIERKNLSDLFASLTSERKRFEEEVERLESYVWKGLVIEAEEKEVLEPYEFSDTKPMQIFSSLCSLDIRGFHIYYAKSRKKAQDWVLSRLLKFYKYMRTKNIQRGQDGIRKTN